MRLQRLFLPLLGTAVVLAIGGGYLSSLGGNTVRAELNGELSRSLLRQGGRDRIWKASSFHKALTVASGPGVQLFGPLQLKVDASEALYVLDLGDVTIKKFSPDGRYLATYGKGRGQGPGEFASLTDFVVGPTGEVWVADLSNGRLTVFAPGGEVARTLKLEQPPYRLTFGGNGLFLMLAPVSDHLFGLYDGSAHLRRSFGTFLENQGRNAMVLDGWLVPGNEGGFVYAGYYDGLIAGYDAAGRQRFLAEALGRPPLPKMVRDGEKTWVDRDAPIVIYSLSATPGRIHLLSTYASALRKSGSVDTYDAGDGRYLFSRHIPEKCSGLVVSPRYTYTIDDNRVTRWEGGA